MKIVLKRMTSSVLLTAMVGALLVTNTVPAAGSQTTASVEVGAAGRCHLLTPVQMQAVQGGKFWEDVALVVDIGCGATSLLGVFGKVHPAAVGFCAGWFIGRLITG